MRPEFAKARTGVFWDVEDFPIPVDLDPETIYQGVRSSLASEAYDGKVKIEAYQKKDVSDEMFHHYLSSGIMFVPQVLEGFTSTVDKMILGIFIWAMNNPAPANLLVMSKNISEESELTGVLQGLKSRNYNLLLAKPETISAPSGALIYLSPIESSSSSSRHEKVSNDARTGVFWDVEDLPIPVDLDPETIYHGLRLTLAKKRCSCGVVNIWTYGEKNKIPDGSLSAAATTFVLAGDKCARQKKMLTDILFWAIDNPTGSSNLIVVSRTGLQNATFVRILGILESRHYNVLWGVPEEHPRVSYYFHWNILLDGGSLLDQCGSSQPSLTDKKKKKKKRNRKPESKQ